ncbi:MAG: nucleotide exchange factor GrpE [Candidatus Limnocylindrales bacterium]|jgi:molecular chaperone GrpE
MPDRPTHLRTHHRGAAGDWPGRPSDGGPEAPEPTVEELGAQLQAAKALAAEHLASLQRTAADFANFKRRTSEDRERELGLAGELLLRKLLAVADDFDRALEAMPPDLKGVSWIEGVVLLDRKLRALLESEGVTPIEAVGRTFDPREHEAIASIPGTGRPDGEIVAEVQRGYRVRDRVLRPALVAVAGGSAAAGDTTSHTN